MNKKNLIAICFDQTGQPYKYQYKLIMNSPAIISFEKFCVTRGYKYINYYFKDNGIFYKRKNL